MRKIYFFFIIKFIYSLYTYFFLYIFHSTKKEIFPLLFFPDNIFSPSPRANSSLMICVATMADSRLDNYSVHTYTCLNLFVSLFFSRFSFPFLPDLSPTSCNPSAAAPAKQVVRSHVFDLQRASLG